MVRAIGGDLAGMSTTLEAIAAREAGMEILGISLVTNLAAGISGEPLNHEEVLEAGQGRGLADGRPAVADRAADLGHSLGTSTSQPPGELRQRAGGLAAYGHAPRPPAGRARRSTCSVSPTAPSVRSACTRTPRQLAVDRQLGRARPGLAEVALGRDLQAHLGRPPVLVVEPGHHGRRGDSSQT